MQAGAIAAAERDVKQCIGRISGYVITAYTMEQEYRAVAYSRRYKKELTLLLVDDIEAQIREAPKERTGDDLHLPFAPSIPNSPSVKWQEHTSCRTPKSFAYGNFYLLSLYHNLDYCTA